MRDIEERLRVALPVAESAPLQKLASALFAAWSEPHRAYNSAQHLSECLQAFDAVRIYATDPAAVLLALLFHDAIYDPTRHDNEQRSADWAAAVLPSLGAPVPLTKAVSALVMATQTHRVDGDGADADDMALLLDIDLAILGSSPERFTEYEAQIRREYAFVPDCEYSIARRHVMQGFAERDPLYLTSHFQQRLQVAARRNLSLGE